MKRVFFAPQLTQVHQKYGLPFFGVSSPDGSVQPVIFPSLTQYVSEYILLYDLYNNFFNFKYNYAKYFFMNFSLKTVFVELNSFIMS